MDHYKPPNFRVALLCLLVSIVFTTSEAKSNQSIIHSLSQEAKQTQTQTDKVLILDIDNCVYSEAEIRARSSTGQGIEQQIIDNTHEFGHKELNLTKKECDEMYIHHGSTVEGIRQKLLSDGNKGEEEIQQVLRDYYQHVYDGIDMTCLLPQSDAYASASSINTGYNHARSRMRRQVIRDLLQNIPNPIYFASNSPKQHVLKVLSALGLREVKYDGLLTPDTIHAPVHRDGDGDSNRNLYYPTKFHPAEFFQSILEKYDADDLILVDDSRNNLDKARGVGIKGLRVNGEGGMTLELALSMVAGHIESSIISGRDDAYRFSDIDYLKSKNVVDMKAINADVWAEMLEKLFQYIDVDEKIVRIVDVGAGLLSMLELVLNGAHGKEPLIANMKHGMKLEYIAYESNLNLIDACQDRLRALGFEEVSSEQEDEYVFRRDGHISVTAIVRMRDFANDRLGSKEYPHLIVGCCFADLFEPDALVSSIARFINHYSYGGGLDVRTNKASGTLVYFPITFSGTTQFFPPSPFGIASSGKVIPSDTLAFQLYAESLISEHEHNLDPSKIVEAMKNAGASLLTKGPSIWHIDPKDDNYLWNTMLYFFGSSAAPQIIKRQWDSVGWLDRAKASRPIIKVTNQDLLFNLPLPQDENAGSHESSCADLDVVEEIEFRSPNVVGKKVKATSITLGPNQVEGKSRNAMLVKYLHVFNCLELTVASSHQNDAVKSICSLISSGTELKIFKGLFDEAQLDVNIDGMEDETMQYPLAYGYSLVGVVTKCGEEVADRDELIGKIVFTFSPHSTHVVVDRNGIQIIPDGIDAEDAMFMPSVETALSIIHDANIRGGENVAVYGQGLIGLLVNGILSCQTLNLSSGEFGRITVFDTISERLSMASEMGSSQALLPHSAAAAGPFDVSIEVSGNFRALQSAIDHTRNGGRIIVGSWYGNSDIHLKLGIDFHRSHKTIKTSQVSTIPAELTTLWSKERRFALTWELVKLLRPHRLITRKVTLDEAQTAYEKLDKGEEIAVSFTYENKA